MSLTSYRAAPPRVTMIELRAGTPAAPGYGRAGTFLSRARDGYEEELVGTRFEDLAMTYSPTP